MMGTEYDALPERLRSKIRVDDASGCWVWTACVAANGYGRAWDGGIGRSDWVHRIVYRVLVGPIPEGLTLDHVKARGCVHLACCNPAHLEPVTHKVNHARSSNPAVTAARHRSQTECLNHHPLTADNVTVRGGRRHCRTCARAYSADYRARNLDRIRERDRQKWRERQGAAVLIELLGAMR